MGVSIGRILIIPKGEWNDIDTYEKLDLVRHNGASWICKNSCTGMEPTDENSENWFLIAKDGEGISLIIDMVGATADTDGVRGFVPAPKAGDEAKALLGDGTWGTVDAIYTFKTEEEYNQAVINDEIPDGAKVVKEYDEQFINIPVDSEMSDGSMNPVQNKVVKNYVDKLHGITLTGALTSGETVITLTDASITTDSTIDIYTDVYGVSPKTVDVTDGNIVMAFNEQSVDVQIKVVVS